MIHWSPPSSFEIEIVLGFSGVVSLGAARQIRLSAIVPQKNRQVNHHRYHEETQADETGQLDRVSRMVGIAQNRIYRRRVVWQMVMGYHDEEQRTRQ